MSYDSDVICIKTEGPFKRDHRYKVDRSAAIDHWIVCGKSGARVVFQDMEFRKYFIFIKELIKLRNNKVKEILDE